MIVLAKLIIGIVISLTAKLQLSKEPTQEYVVSNAPKTTELDATRLRAYQILNTKCNAGHNKRIKRRVFTPDNMNPSAKDIHKQVFIKNECPRG